MLSISSTMKSNSIFISLLSQPRLSSALMGIDLIISSFAFLNIFPDSSLPDASLLYPSFSSSAALSRLSSRLITESSDSGSGS